jgi:hypothetical protein
VIDFEEGDPALALTSGCMHYTPCNNVTTSTEATSISDLSFHTLPQLPANGLSQSTTASMAALIPPLDFTSSPNSFCATDGSPTKHSESDTEDVVSSRRDSAAACTLSYSERKTVAASPENVFDLRRESTVSTVSTSGRKLVKRNKSQKATKLLSCGSRKGWRSYRVQPDITTPVTNTDLGNSAT